MKREAVRKSDKSLPFGKNRLQSGIELRNDLVGQQQHHDVRTARRLLEGDRRKAVAYRVVEAATGPSADRYRDSGVAQIEGVRPSLVSVTEDGHGVEEKWVSGDFFPFRHRLGILRR